MATMYYRPYTTEPLKDDELPSHGAVESILPNYQYIFVDSDHDKHLGASQGVLSRSQMNPDGKSDTRLRTDTKPLEQESMPQYLVDHHMKELENYRTAVHKMGQDLLVLREQLRWSETSNSQLRTDLARYDETTKFMLDSSKLDGITKPELVTRYGTLKQKISSQSNELKGYKEKVCHLQNEIIKKNDEAKDFISIRNAHQSQQDMLHKLQERNKKNKKLEDTCRKQEKVIEKLEMHVEKHKHRKHNELASDTHDVLLDENKRLRWELAQTKEQLSSQSNTDPVSDSRTLELHQALEKANGRTLALEKQIDINAHSWGRERANLLLRLNETERGFNPTIGISDAFTGRFLEQYMPASLKENRRKKSGQHKQTSSNCR